MKKSNTSRSLVSKGSRNHPAEINQMQSKDKVNLMSSHKVRTVLMLRLSDMNLKSDPASESFSDSTHQTLPQRQGHKKKQNATKPGRHNVGNISIMQLKDQKQLARIKAE
jgi:hypothetical protein